MILGQKKKRNMKKTMKLKKINIFNFKNKMPNFINEYKYVLAIIIMLYIYVHLLDICYFFKFI